jgi:hypothetical protein
MLSMKSHGEEKPRKDLDQIELQAIVGGIHHEYFPFPKLPFPPTDISRPIDGPLPWPLPDPIGPAASGFGN